jgi:hypothetical protein
MKIETQNKHGRLNTVVMAAIDSRWISSQSVKLGESAGADALRNRSFNEMLHESYFDGRFEDSLSA